MILVVFLFVIILLLLIYLYMKRKSKREDQDILLLSQSQSETLDQISQINERTYEAANNITPEQVTIENEDGTTEEVDVTIDADTLRDQQAKCAFKQLVPGRCPDGFSISKNNCCELLPGKNPNSSDVALSIMKMLAREIFISELVEFAVMTAAPKIVIQTGKLLAGSAGRALITRLQKEAVEEAAERGAKAASKLVSKAVSKAIVKGSTKLATRVGVKMAAFGIKTLTKLSSGPVGAALMVFDLASLGLDLFDPAGYELFIENSENAKVRRQHEYMMQMSAGGEEYPILFPVEMWYKDAWEAAYESVSSDYDNQVINNFTQAETDKYVEIMIKVLLGDENAGEDLAEITAGKKEFLMNQDPIARDRKIYRKLLEILPSAVHKNLAIYEYLSSDRRSGISLSREGAMAWNQMNYNTWMNWESRDRGNPAPFVAVFSDKYRVVNMNNPGTAQEPNLIEKTLRQKAPYIMPWQTLYTLCEKPRRGGLTSSTSTSINPKSYGVKFEPETGRCIFTPRYCAHFALDYKSGGETDCEPYEGQEVAETIFGKTVTRSFIKLGNEIAGIFS